MQELWYWLGNEVNKVCPAWDDLADLARMLERLDLVWDAQTRALVATRCDNVSEQEAYTCINKARTQGTGFVPRPLPGQARKDAARVPAVKAMRLFVQLVNRKV